VTVQEKIKQAKSKHDLDLLRMEIIMDAKNIYENMRALAEKMKELDKQGR